MAAPPVPDAGDALPNEPEETEFVLPPIPSDDDFSKDPEVWDIIVVGAGVAGSAFAHQQGRDGRRVLLLERDLRQPDRIVGELLQPGGVAQLRRLGLAHCLEGIDAQRVGGYAMFRGGREARVAYPAPPAAAGAAAADVSGRSFHNGRFVQRLREAAAAAPGVTVRQGAVTALAAPGGVPWPGGDARVAGVLYRDAGGAARAAAAHLTVACDGMYSALRGRLRSADAAGGGAAPEVRHPSYFVGLLLRGAALPHPGFGHVVLAEPSPVLFYPISSTEVRCLVDYPGERLPPAAGGGLERHLLGTVAPQVPPGLRAPFEAAVRSGRVRSMQNKQLAAAPLRRPGALMLGDAFNMRHPLTGGGMTVALADANLLCDMLRPLPSLRDAGATSDATAAFHVRRAPLAATINTLANALYDVFSARGGGAAPEEMRRACFDYLALGGACSAGPVALLGGLDPRPSVLVAHFFSVALFGVGRLLLPRPTLRGVWLGALLVAQAVRIIWPIILAEGPVAVFLPALARAPRLSGAMRREASVACLAAAAVAADAKRA